jgi:hypothetical protein
MVEVSNQAKPQKGEFFGPSISFLSKQIEPYTINAGLAGELSFGISKDIPEDGKLGWSVNLGLSGSDSFNLSPNLNYRVTSKITASVSSSISSKLEVRSTIGLQYQISKQKIAAMNLVANFKDLTTIGDTMLVLSYIY